MVVFEGEGVRRWGETKDVGWFLGGAASCAETQRAEEAVGREGGGRGMGEVTHAKSEGDEREATDSHQRKHEGYRHGVHDSAKIIILLSRSVGDRFVDVTMRLTIRNPCNRMRTIIHTTQNK